MLLVTVPSALRLIQLDTRDAALVVKLPLLHVHPNSPVESLVTLPLTCFLRCLVLWILEPFSRNVFYENISKFSLSQVTQLKLYHYRHISAGILSVCLAPVCRLWLRACGCATRGARFGACAGEKTRHTCADESLTV